MVEWRRGTEVLREFGCTDSWVVEYGSAEWTRGMQSFWISTTDVVLMLTQMPSGRREEMADGGRKEWGKTNMRSNGMAGWQTDLTICCYGSVILFTTTRNKYISMRLS